MARQTLHSTPIIVINQFPGPTRIFPATYKGQLILESASGDYFKATSSGKNAEWEKVNFLDASSGSLLVTEDLNHVGFADLALA